EEKVRREEARVRGQQEIAASSLDAQFESLEDLGEKTEVEARLAALKAGGAGQAALTSGDVDADETLTLDYAAEETGTARG
ncbi:PspA/IM30 family protein, partial [Micrococcus luteus]|nr:PspA/IM30 family protein [Micrococcus luteus]